MLSISMTEWAMELLLNLTMIIYVKYINGYSNFLNKFSWIFFTFVQFSILPLFYLMGDKYYRALVTHHGYLKALWIRLLKFDE